MLASNSKSLHVLVVVATVGRLRNDVMAGRDTMPTLNEIHSFIHNAGGPVMRQCTRHVLEMDGTFVLTNSS